METRDKIQSTTEYFAVFEQDESIDIGDVVTCDEPGVIRPIVRHYHKSKNKVPYGISLNRVIEPDYERCPPHMHELMKQGYRIEIIRRGNIIYPLDFQNLPINQPVYADGFTSKLTWKKLGPKVGYLTANQDKDGWCNIYVNFVGV